MRADHLGLTFVCGGAVVTDQAVVGDATAPTHLALPNTTPLHYPARATTLTPPSPAGQMG